jgi:MYXO-CTERM domain-containing protein
MFLRRALAFPLLVTVAACTVPGADVELTAAGAQPIIGGIPDTFRSYVVGVGNYDAVHPNAPSNGAQCSGTLISKRTVLTAGHCYDPQLPNGGIDSIFFGPYIGPPFSASNIVSVDAAARMPGFNNTSLHNDLTLVHLQADPPPGYEQPAPLLRETMANTPEWIGPNFTFVGYGNDGFLKYDTRRVVAFPIDRIGPASDVGQDTGSGPIDATMFYFRVPKKNTCDGDSGGPAFVVRNGVERHAGSTSYGDGPCHVDGVDQRTDLPNIMAFIQVTIDQFENNDPCRADGVCNESCNTNNTLIDPDCAPNHCGADGMCVISCVDPPDPDCTGVNHCGADGVCDPSCAGGDVDCLPPPDGGSSTSSSSSSTTSSSSSSTTSSSGGGAGGAGGAGGSDADAGTGGKSERSSGGCGCAVPGEAEGSSRAALAVLALGLGLARRRQR